MSQNLQLTDAEVVDYLQQHLDFFVGKDALLMQLRVPHATTGQAASLLERQLTVQRERNVELRQKLTDLLENARRNDQVYQKSKRLVLHIMEAQCWLDIQAVLDDALRKEFSVDNWALLHFTERRLEAPLCVIQNPGQQRALHRLFKGHRAICGQLPKGEMAILLNQPETDTASIAAVQIRGKESMGVLTLASNQPHAYHHTMDTVFLEYLADVLALRLAQVPVSHA